MFPRIILLAAMLNGGLAFSLFAQASAAAGVVQVEVTPELRFRAKTFARESDSIVNPIPWVQFKDMLPEGTRVQKGDMVFHLDVQGVLLDIADLENRIEEAENNTALRLAEMRKSAGNLADQLAEKIDARDIQIARLDYLKSLPLAADIEIAKGRLEVATKKLEADAEELRKSKERLAKNLISPAMLEEDNLRYTEQLARTRYAEEMFELAQLKAHPKQIEIVEFRIRNLDLEIGKLNSEIPIKEKILEIETEALQRRIDDLKDRLADSQEQLANEFIYAPSDGVLTYSPALKRELTKGGKATKSMELAQIPRRESMALEGEIPEQVRHLYQVGDPAVIHLNLYPGRSFKGKVASISPFSRDVVEGENPSGVKVVDLIVEFDNLPETLPLGVYGWVNLSPQKPVSGWAVPASWIRFRGGKAHVSVQGRMQAVNGVISGDQFLLSPPHPAAELIQAEGEWTETDNPGVLLSTDQFMVTGELIPFESEMIRTPRVRAWDMKISWLSPENIQIEKGDPLITLESEQLTRDLANRKLDVKRLQGERESAEEELSISLSEKEFQLSSAQNRIEIMKRERDLVFISGSTSEVLQSQLNLHTADIQLKKAETELARNVRNAEWSAASEQERLAREVVRRKLEREKAQLNLTLAEQGATSLEKSKADLNLLQEMARAADLEAQHYRNLTRAQSQLRWRVAREKNERERLERQKNSLISIEVKAPVSGLVKYSKVWDGVRQSKIKTGMSVWRGMQLISLSAAEKLYVEVSIPERYIRYLTPDMLVSVRIPSEGGMQWHGKLIHQEEILEPASQIISTQSLYGNREASSDQVLKVRILIENSEGTSLKPGAIAQIIFPFDK
jgi:multidrug resistance efflux pump